MGIFNQNNGVPPGRSGLGGRLLLGVIIAIFGLIAYMSQVQENPVTGQRQHVSMTPDQEVRLGLESAPQMAREMGGELPANDPRVRTVKKIGQFLVANTDAIKSPWKFQFHLLNDNSTVNAFALPGGQIFITLGLLNKLQTEAQLAGVLGHEMGHVIERHSAQQMAKGQLGQLLVMAVGAAASDPSNQGRSFDPIVIASVINQMVQLRYSRHDESQADIWGLQLMQQVKLDPKAMIRVMEILKASGGGSSLAIFQSHPDPDLRIAQIKDYLDKHPKVPNLTEGRNLKDFYNEYQKDL